VLRLVQQFGPDLSPPEGVRSERAWLRKVARHDVQDQIRRLASARKHVAPRRNADGDDASPSAREVADPAPTPEAMLHRAACWRTLVAALDALDREAHLYFIYHHLIGFPVSEIAAANDQPDRHVYHVLERAGRALRKRLEAEGLTVGEMRRCFDSPAPATPRLPTDDEPE
jgi:DNA-directed RNA polymerase specialized sigma24 family protein